MDNQGPIEVALSTDLRGEPYYFSLWDIHTGSQLVVFKGNKGNPIARCLKLIDSNYFITAIDNLIQIWSIYNRKCQEQKLFLPGRPSALCMSPCGNYLIVGISEMIYIWQINSGNLLSHNQRHYQTVTVLKMNHDGTFLFSGGEDGTVLVWPFADLISGTHNTGALNLDSSRTDTGVNEPRFTWQHHSAPITDIHVTNGGRCITSSIDKTINIYSYASGRRLHCVADFPAPILCLTANKNETRIFLGGQDGNIYEVLLSSLSLSLFNSGDLVTENSRKPTLVGHKDKVTHLQLSLDGTTLISGSLDSTCKIWDIYQRKLLRDVKHQAPLANLVTLLVPEAFSLASITQSLMKPPLSVKSLKRNLYKMPRDGGLMKNDLFEEASTSIVNIKNHYDYSKNLSLSIATDKSIALDETKTSSLQLNGKQVDDSGDSKTNVDLKSRLRDLYLLSAEKIFEDVAHESLRPFKEMVEKFDDIKSDVKESRKAKKLAKNQLKRKTKSDEDVSRIPLSGKSASAKPITNGVTKKPKKAVDSSLFV